MAQETSATEFTFGVSSRYLFTHTLLMAWKGIKDLTEKGLQIANKWRMMFIPNESPDGWALLGGAD
jgi:hypothetical protein